MSPRAQVALSFFLGLVCAAALALGTVDHRKVPVTPQEPSPPEEVLLDLDCGVPLVYLETLDAGLGADAEPDVDPLATNDAWVDPDIWYLTSDRYQ